MASVYLSHIRCFVDIVCIGCPVRRSDPIVIERIRHNDFADAIDAGERAGTTNRRHCGCCGEVIFCEGVAAGESTAADTCYALRDCDACERVADPEKGTTCVFA